MITSYNLSAAHQLLIDAVPEPKNVLVEPTRVLVFTAEHYVPPPQPTREELDVEEARTHSKLQALAKMTPAQVDTWVKNNVTNLAQAQDAIATLAVAVSILARRI